MRRLTETQLFEIFDEERADGLVHLPYQGCEDYYAIFNYWLGTKLGDGTFIEEDSTGNIYLV